MDADAANANADAGDSTIALRELCSGELKMKSSELVFDLLGLEVLTQDVGNKYYYIWTYL